jgi:hypothetical protein
VAAAATAAVETSVRERHGHSVRHIRKSGSLALVVSLRNGHDRVIGIAWSDGKCQQRGVGLHELGLWCRCWWRGRLRGRRPCHSQGLADQILDVLPDPDAPFGRESALSPRQCGVRAAQDERDPRRLLAARRDVGGDTARDSAYRGGGLCRCVGGSGMSRGRSVFVSSRIASHRECWAQTGRRARLGARTTMVDGSW